MVDINTTIKKMTEFIDKGRRGKQNGPSDIQYNAGVWQHRHANYHPEKASRGLWHPMHTKHKSLHDDWFNTNMSFISGKLPEDIESQRQGALLINEKYFGRKPSVDEVKQQLEIEGIIGNEDWNENKVPTDIKSKITEGIDPWATPEQQEFRPTIKLTPEQAPYVHKKETPKAKEEPEVGEEDLGEELPEEKRYSPLDDEAAKERRGHEKGAQFENWPDRFKEAGLKYVTSEDEHYVSKRDDKDKLIANPFSVEPVTTIDMGRGFAVKEYDKLGIDKGKLIVVKEHGIFRKEHDALKSLYEQLTGKTLSKIYAAPDIDTIKEYLEDEFSAEKVDPKIVTELAKLVVAELTKPSVGGAEGKLKAIVRNMVIDYEAQQAKLLDSNIPEPIDVPEKKESKELTDEQLLTNWSKDYATKDLSVTKDKDTNTGEDRYVVKGIKNKINPIVIYYNEKSDTPYEMLESDGKEYTELGSHKTLKGVIAAVNKHLFPEKVNKMLVKSSLQEDKLFGLLNNYSKFSEETLSDNVIDYLFRALLSEIMTNKPQIDIFAVENNITAKLVSDINKFETAKDRTDKVIAIDAYMHLSHQNTGLLPTTYGIIDSVEINNKVKDMLTDISENNNTWRISKQLPVGGGVATAGDTFVPTFNGNSNPSKERDTEAKRKKFAESLIQVTY